MKDTITISLEKGVKERFSKFAKSLGTNPTNLLNMMIIHSMNTKSITFCVPNISWEFESFSKSELDDIMSDSKITQGLQEMQSIFQK